MAEVRRRTIYGRRRGKPLRRSRAETMRVRLPGLRIDLRDVGEGGLDPRTLFASPAAVWLEIGFGGGEHLAAQAESHPDIGMIGCEPFYNGVARLVGAVDERDLSNIRIHDDDAAALLRALAPSSIDRAFLLFPDPWPKRRHHRRRFVQQENLDLLAGVLKPGAQFRVATDDLSYLRWILERLTMHSAFEWQVAGPGDWRHRVADWPETRYEQKALAQGRKPTYLSFRRR